MVTMQKRDDYDLWTRVRGEHNALNILGDQVTRTPLASLNVEY